ncbi:MAG: 50S ribosome-binding GTPase, partial [Candidatus Omnitrophica bacterium]|nr:50S ribosome-binding GTPase [Candidatus Omnitrophota bacterium]
MEVKKIVLAGNPNSGKSAIFSRLTGIDVISSNYPGTTIEIMRGMLKIKDKKYEIIDSPGIYSFNFTNIAEEITAKTIDEADILINVVDSTNLERCLNLTLQLIKKQKQLILILNFWDETKHKGIEIDYKKLQEILGIPVIPVCAITGEGIKELVERIQDARISKFDFYDEKKWEKIGEIVENIQKVHHKHHTLLERIDELTINTVPGIFIAIFILILSFFLIRITGESLINNFLDPIFNNFYMPFVNNLNNTNIPEFFKKILFGTNNEVMESFGIITTGIYIPFVIVLPYIFVFYVVLSFLEDSGYLPRLSVLLDGILHRFGIHGYSSIPILLGLGCKVPA